IVHVSARTGAVDGDTLRIFSCICAGRGRDCWVIEINVAGCVVIDSESQLSIGINIELYEQVAGGRDDISFCCSTMSCESNVPGVRKEQADLSSFRIASAKMQIEEFIRSRIDRYCAANTIYDSYKSVSIQVKAQRSSRRSGDVWQIRLVTSNDNALELIRKS